MPFLDTIACMLDLERAVAEGMTQACVDTQQEDDVQTHLDAIKATLDDCLLIELLGEPPIP